MPESHAPQNSALLQGLILLGLIVFGIYLVHERGLFGVLLSGDRSYLSLVIFAVWAVMSLRWLYLLRYVQQWRDQLAVPRAAMPAAQTDQIEAMLARWLNHGWLAADSVLKLGLLGTIIGFILMLSPIAGLSGYDAASLQAALTKMSGGMAVALYTTLAGLVANLLLRVQFQLLADAMQALLLDLSNAIADASANKDKAVNR
ncbi:MAG: MotA/TolQ/ExbB proton channel family protein [Parvibaculales bacterium]